MQARELLDRTDLATLLTQLGGHPVGHGRSTRWPCFAPGHDDEHPSVTMFVDRNGIERWKCWSDGNAGTAIDAVMIAHSVEVPAAIGWLKERIGEQTQPIPRRTPSRTPQHRPLSAQLRRWVNECEHRLWQPDGAGALEWLHDRGLHDPVLRANRIGFDPGNHIMPRPRGLPRRRGVTVCSFDPHGELAYVQVRNLDANADSKYTNPTPRHGTLPPITFPRGGPTHGILLVTEGVFDGLTAIQAGYRSAALISTSSAGGATAHRTTTAIRNHAAGDTIVLALDGDPAGRNATRQLQDHLTGCDVRVLHLPDNHDLTSLHTRKAHPAWQPTTAQIPQHASTSFSTT